MFNIKFCFVLFVKFILYGQSSYVYFSQHYFYADLPAGYQITQQRRPIAQVIGQVAELTTKN
jgi:Asp-tRNA(Asn)/Glu-tRNA(Gln) amidotransferase B subunit